MKKWNNPEIAELNISETAEKKPEGWDTWTCPALAAGTCEAGKQNWGTCKKCTSLLNSAS